MNLARRRLSAPIVMGLGAAAYLIMAGFADVWVVGSPAGNRALQTMLLMLLGLAFVPAAEGFLAVIGAIRSADLLGWPSLAAAVGSVAYSLAYGHRVFVNYWYYDDWGYFAWLARRPDTAFLTTPINDHFVPLLKLLVWATDRAFGFNYIGAACLQQIAFLIIVVVLAHLLWEAGSRPWLVIFWTGLFAMWPAYGAARTWFGGGFWLTASAALLLVYVLHTRSMILGPSLLLSGTAVSAVLAVATVLISSQTIAPAVYAAAFCGPSLLLRPRCPSVRRFGMLAGVSLVPTAIALWGRHAYVVRPPMNLSGLLNGDLLRNLGVFILNKALFSKVFGGIPPLAAVAALLLLPAGVALWKIASSERMQPDRPAFVAGLVLLGGSIFVVALAQIGMGRRWDYDAVLNPYYITFPFLGIWLAWAGIGLALLPSAKGTFQWTRAAAAVAAAVVVAAGGISSALPRDERPPGERLRLIRLQRQFLDDLGAAVCDLSRLRRGSGPAVRWVPADILNCRVCEQIIGPPAFLQDSKPALFNSIAHFAGYRSCPGTDLTNVLPAGAAQSRAVIRGTESRTVTAFVQRYFCTPPNSRLVLHPLIAPGRPRIALQ
jgi:hypothetical protein